MNDIGNIDDIHVLVGLQGSGMINGLYMSDSAVSVAIYLNDQWPIVTKDPLLLLKYKHNFGSKYNKHMKLTKNTPSMYIPYINKNTSNIICNYEKNKNNKNNKNNKKSENNSGSTSESGSGSGVADLYCDGANFHLSEDLFIELILKGLDSHDQYCSGL